MTLRYEGVRFSDGSIAVRRVSADPCARATLNFESVRELEDDIGSAEVSWIADRGTAPPLAVAPGLYVCELALGETPKPPPISIATEEDWRKHVGGRPPAWFLNLPDDQPVQIRPAYVGDGHPAVRAAELDRYVPEPEEVESI